MRYLATIYVPGYMPWDDDPPVFDTAAEAWGYLRDERMHAEDDAPDWTDHDCDFPQDCEYSDTFKELDGLAKVGADQHWDGTDFVQGLTPGYDGDHDLGVLYSVTVVEED